jgi:hypothetical protein
MPVKQKYSPDQRLLGAYVDGLPKTADEIPPTAKELIDQPDTHQSVYIPRAYEEGEYSYSDMVNLAIPVVWSVDGVRVLVCPTCKTDLEPAFPPVVKPETKPLYSDKTHEKLCSFCTCPKCGATYLLPEIVAQRSFRLALPNEDTTGYYTYLKSVYLHGEWRVLLADSLPDS